MTFSNRILIGLGAGVVCGLFFGESIAPVKVLADGFVKLLQMTVLPYVTLSIVTSLGSLNYADARRLGLRAGAVVAGLWLVAIGFAFLAPLTFPDQENASFFSSSLVERRASFNLVDLYIPSNPFHSLANNVVPAVVLFSVMIGISLIGVPQKQRLLEILSLTTSAVSRATRTITRLTPIGIFAIAAHAAGTLSLEEVGRIQVYLFAYVTLGLLLSLYVLPGLVSALTPIPYREVLGPNRDALVTAFIAGDLFIVLPALTDVCTQVLVRYKLTSHDEHKLPDVIVPASFNFPHSGKLLSLSFILFAGWFANAALPASHYPQLAATGLLTFFGSLNAAVPFLLDMFRIPADTFQLFLATGVINSRFGTLLAAVHTIVVALLGSASVAGALKFQPARLIRYGLTVLILTAGAILGLRLLFSTVLRPRFEGAEVVYGMKPLWRQPDSVVLQGDAALLPPSSDQGGVVKAIQSRGALRVGFFPNRMPYVFFNREHKLVGLSVEMAQSLARDLGVRAEFIQLDMDDLAPAMATGRCDIIMTGVMVTPRRQAITLFSRAVLDETLSFAVLDHRRQEFASWADVRQARGLRIAVSNIPYYISLAQQLMPQATIVPIDPDTMELDAKAGFDAYLVAAERGSIQTMLQPQYTIVVPEPGVIRMPIAYPLAQHDREWADVVNTWIELKMKDGTVDALYQHWILGNSAKPRAPRWSVLRNLLHWGE